MRRWLWEEQAMSETTGGYAAMMVRLQLAGSNAALLTTAADLARRCGARLIGAAVCQPMQIIYGDGYVMGDLIREDQEQIQRELREAEAEFRATVTAPGAQWRAMEIFTGIPDYLADEARC